MSRLFITFVLFLTGCGASSGDNSSPTATFRGSVSYVEVMVTEGGAVGSTLVEGPRDAAYSIDRISLTITTATLFSIDGISLAGSDGLSQLRPGDLVEGSVSGAVAESYPVQGSAASITVLEGMSWNTTCATDADCRLVDREYGFNCCWIGACRTIDYAEERWLPVDGLWFDRMRQERCPAVDQCGPAPACPDQIVGDPHEAICDAGSCVKRKTP